MSNRTFGIEFECGVGTKSPRDYDYDDYVDDDGDYYDDDINVQDIVRALKNEGIPAYSWYDESHPNLHRQWCVSEDCGGVEIHTPICNSGWWPHIHEVMAKANGVLDTYEGAPWGTHVHIGSEDISPTKFLVLWTKLESTLFQLVSPSRRSCGWCNPIVQQGFSWEVVRQRALSNIGFGDRLPFKWAISFSHFNTIECRMHECTTNTHVIFPWVQMLRSLGDLAANGMDMHSLVNLVETTPPVDLIRLAINDTYTPAESDCIWDGLKRRAQKYRVPNLFT